MPGTSTSSMGEFMLLERDGKKYVVHPNKGGFVFVYDRNRQAVSNVYKACREHQLRQGHRARTATLVGRRDLAEGKSLSTAVPGNRRRHSAGMRARYNPKTGLSVQGRLRMVHDLDSREDRRRSPSPWSSSTSAARRSARGTRRRQDARSHPRARSGSPARSSLKSPYPGAIPHASLLTTAGNVLFVPEADGTLVAYDASQRQEAVGAQQRPRATTAASSPTWPRASSTWR